MRCIIVTIELSFTSPWKKHGHFNPIDSYTLLESLYIRIYLYPHSRANWKTSWENLEINKHKQNNNYM